MTDKIFGVRKPVIGMVHLGDLYSPKGMDYIIDRAFADAYNLHLGGGVDALLIENWEEQSDKPFAAERTVKRILQVFITITERHSELIKILVFHLYS